MSWRKMGNLRRCGKRYTLCLSLASLMMLTSGFTPDNIHHVRIIVDGQSIETHTASDDLEKILERSGVQLREQDEYYAKETGNHTEITIHRALPIAIEYKGERREAMTTKSTVGEALSDLGYNVNDYKADPGLDAEIEENLHIRLDDSDAVKAAEAARKAEEERRRSMQIETSRGMAHYSEAMTMEASAYLPSDGGGSGITASGMVAQRGVVAVDPRVIPLGTRLYIPGYGDAVAGDTGGAIKGHKIDLCMESYNEAMQFGRRSVTVYILQ